MKYKFIFFLSVICLFFTGCEKELVEHPTDFISPDQFFSNEEESIQAVNGVYRLIPGLFGSGGFWNVTMVGADVILQDKSDRNLSQIYRYNPTSDGGAGSIWNSTYSTIMSANMVLENLTEASINEELKSRLIGEVKFIRAMQYYFLANTFGGVPLWTDELNIEKISTLSRSSIEEVRDQIKKDLKDAATEEVLPNRFTGSDTGRANRAAALTLLAMEYLIEEDWEGAKKAALKVSEMPEYQLNDDYGENFLTRNSPESIFEIQYLRNAQTDQNFVENNYYTFFMPPVTAPGEFAGVDFGSSQLQSYANFYPTKKFVSLFEEGDHRKDYILAYGYDGQKFEFLNENGTPYFGLKFWDFEANNYHSGKNLPFLRLADIYMILAEAENELGNTGEALLWLNQIRSRANLEDLNGLSQQEVREEIMDENAIEFVGEFKRKWDLIRWGKLMNAVKSISDDNPEGAGNIDEHYLLYPINENEIIKNDNLEQNPGY